MLSLFGTFFWDPDPVLFTLPWIDHPVRMYGICFVLGFFLGFFIIVPMFKQRLALSTALLERDIKNWAALARTFALFRDEEGHSIQSIYKKLGKDSKSALNGLTAMQEPTDVLKEDMLYALNQSLKSYGRDDIERLFPEGIASLKEQSVKLADRLTWFIIAGGLIGARLGHVFFYEWAYYQHNLLSILKVWEGGLASHGGVIGIFLALCIYRFSIKNRYPELSFLKVLDYLTVPGALAAALIRIGNFFNQEILGTETTMPWGVVFGHPLDGGPSLPRHPVQLYEALACLITFFVLYGLWKKKGESLQTGTLAGIFFVMVFSGRFFLEFFKSTMHSSLINDTTLQMGQYLSIPFILLGLGLFFYGRIERKKRVIRG